MLLLQLVTSDKISPAASPTLDDKLTSDVALCETQFISAASPKLYK